MGKYRRPVPVPMKFTEGAGSCQWSGGVVSSYESHPRPSGTLSAPLQMGVGTRERCQPQLGIFPAARVCLFGSVPPAPPEPHGTRPTCSNAAPRAQLRSQYHSTFLLQNMPFPQARNPWPIFSLTKPHIIVQDKVV